MNRLDRQVRGNLDESLTREAIESYEAHFNSEFRESVSGTEKHKGFLACLSAYCRAPSRPAEFEEFLMRESRRLEDWIDQFSVHQVHPELKKYMDIRSVFTKENLRSHLLLRLADHEPEDFFSGDETAFKQAVVALLNEGNALSASSFEGVRKSINFYEEALSPEQLEQLNQLYQKHPGIFGEQDLRIDRQLEETLWFLDMAGLKREQINTFARVAYWLEKHYRNGRRRTEKAKYATDRRELDFNHLLRTADIDIGACVEAQSLDRPPQLYANLDQADIFEKALSDLLHDCLEDNLADLHGQALTPEILRQKLKEFGVPPDMAERLVERSQLLDRKKPFGQETVAPGSDYVAFLHRIYRSNDRFASGAKWADGLQNSQTSAGAQYPDLEASVKPKIKAFEAYAPCLIETARVFSPRVVLSWVRWRQGSEVSRILDEELGKKSHFLKRLYDQVVETQSQTWRVLMVE